ncbi:unnamed protein product [Lampetra planeri]
MSLARRRVSQRPPARLLWRNRYTVGKRHVEARKAAGSAIWRSGIERREGGKTIKKKTPVGTDPAPPSESGFAMPAAFWCVGRTLFLYSQLRDAAGRYKRVASLRAGDTDNSLASFSPAVFVWCRGRPDKDTGACQATTVTTTAAAAAASAIAIALSDTSHDRSA